MTDTIQKLREALQAISHIDDTTNHSVDASAALDHIGEIARQALARAPKPVQEAVIPQGYEIHELPPDYSGPVWIESQVRYLARQSACVSQPTKGLGVMTQKIGLMDAISTKEKK